MALRLHTAASPLFLLRKPSYHPASLSSIAHFPHHRSISLHASLPRCGARVGLPSRDTEEETRCIDDLSLEVDSITETELKQNGFRSTRRTKLVCTIGPACCSYEQLEALAMGGMNVARLNVCHGTKEWHASVVQRVRKLNSEKGYSVALMMDTQGSEIHMGDLVGGSASAAATEDCTDIDFGIHEGFDFIAMSIMKTADAIKHLKSYIAARSPQRPIGIIAKIQSSESLKHIEDIIIVSDGAMVARGDLGAQIPLEQVPSVQQQVVHLCRQLNKPVIVASQLLDSMIEYPMPTRAEVADVSEMVRQQVDALMLSGESAMGRYPEKSLSVLRTVSLRMEEWCRQERLHKSVSLQQLATSLPDQISEEICNSVALMANNLQADAIFAYTKHGHVASLLSRNRPDCPIFAFTDCKDIRIKLNLCWGIIPFSLNFSDDMEYDLQCTFSLLKARGMVKAGDLVIYVSDIAPLSQSNMLQSIQVRRIP